MKLYLDSTDNTQVIIRLDDKEFINKVDSPRNQNVFGFLLSCLEKENYKQEDITEIEVNAGPGSFTGSRIGVSIANALGFALGVKVNGQTNPIEPIYSSPPSITKPSR
ncbi:MAG: Inactive metal-dependent protease-like protein [Candidatus Collierbacteria bacterium GW2011_GWB1_44_6]|uniref:Inactive metal-dependent protease-like protein n=1 Tax=Candidatus Collierbacteria bacterium GW2011_GWB1_44_6 TaxID=1618384 RepID=A0A0G1JQN2_9BACT|nr:MAG: Inactive metal-dependent protease-like protein [Candidatus Collierbacteria bacterium GW2011_GWB1_44_6]KKT81176.1 MAG: Inactive metal-dependent protease-like protein [Microgenomates group bacterium GW2011_GWC1_44_9]